MCINVQNHTFSEMKNIWHHDKDVLAIIVSLTPIHHSAPFSTKWRPRTHAPDDMLSPTKCVYTSHTSLLALQHSSRDSANCSLSDLLFLSMVISHSWQKYTLLTVANFTVGNISRGCQVSWDFRVVARFAVAGLKVTVTYFTPLSPTKHTKSTVTPVHLATCM